MPACAGASGSTANRARPTSRSYAPAPANSCPPANDGLARGCRWRSCCSPHAPRPSPPARSLRPRTRLVGETPAALTFKLRGAAGKQAILSVDRQKPALTWFCVRTNGEAQRQGWRSDVPLADLPRRVGAGDGDVIEACVVETVRPVAYEKFSRSFRQRDRGLLGIKITLGDKRTRLAPTQMLATNLRFDRALETFLQAAGRHGGRVCRRRPPALVLRPGNTCCRAAAQAGRRGCCAAGR